MAMRWALAAGAGAFAVAELAALAAGRAPLWRSLAAAGAVFRLYAFLWSLNLPALLRALAEGAPRFRGTWELAAACLAVQALATAAAVSLLRGRAGGGTLEDNAALAERLTEASGRPKAEVLDLLRMEQREPGSVVAAELRRRGLPFNRWSDGLAVFYAESDAFLFELALYNRTWFKRDLREWVVLRLAGRGPSDVLCHGDGLGFDSAGLAAAGHRVAYHEVSARARGFARRNFDELGATVSMPPPGALPAGPFDAVVCLDVLEHAPDPGALVGELAARLKAGGELIVNAPFWAVDEHMGTHLAENRRFAGSTELYAAHGLRVADGGWAWAPLVLVKDGAPARRASSLKLALLAAVGRVMRSGLFEAVMRRGILGAARLVQGPCLRLFGVSLFEGPARRPF